MRSSWLEFPLRPVQKRNILFVLLSLCTEAPVWDQVIDFLKQNHINCYNFLLYSKNYLEFIYFLLHLKSLNRYATLKSIDLDECKMTFIYVWIHFIFIVRCFYYHFIMGSNYFIIFSPVTYSYVFSYSFYWLRIKEQNVSYL